MKYFLIILSLVLAELGVSQSLQPIPFSNAGWSYVGWILGNNGLPEDQDLYKCYFDGDTSINSITYYKFYVDVTRYFENGSIHNLGSKIYKGGMRNDGNLYYFIHTDSSSETLTYDLSKSSIGDSLPLGFYNAFDYLMVYDTNQRVLQNGNTTLELELSHPWILGYPGPSFFLDGIGYDKGLIPSELFQLQSYDGGIDFHSFCYQGDLVYKISGVTFIPALLCDYTVGMITPKVLNDEVDIFPNPVARNTMLNIEIDIEKIDKRSNLRIYSSTGISLYEMNLIKTISKYELDIASLRPGAYYLQIALNGSLVSKKLIIL